ncbi:hypothetical protein Atai01_01760 [Amycolatopsis taiwanensis]|uniref:Major facilitator superfamily (MFS) profile domain-containing protein n=1 Tax=Amycolatopsis taiwanensis TaxID=342230 RepID=A0A9W6QWW9_9PSEU|nr:hypothetical protein Atai01_01760 [Amycolatopsis taiwanensis]
MVTEDGSCNKPCTKGRVDNAPARCAGKYIAVADRRPARVGQMVIVLDQNIMNVALPAVQRSLGFSAENLVWVVNAYVIPFGGLLL